MMLFADVTETGRNMALVQAFDGIAGMNKKQEGHKIRYELGLANGAAGNQVVKVQIDGGLA